MSFLGRSRELKVLHAAWSSPRSAFLSLYGRRRVGNSELIVHFMSGKPGRYFVGKRASGVAQLQEFLEAAARAIGDSLLAQARVTNWKSALELITKRLPGKARFILARTDLGECEWGEGSSLGALSAELEEKVRRYPNARNATIGRRLFVRRSPANARLPEVRVHTLHDLYNLEP